ncbi:MAG: HIT domain-containing protein [Helicobacter sp.]|nr:HIT domain-containing protein [Helicobacter sp.]
MDRIYSPWRSGYFDSKMCGCVFCEISQNAQDDEKNRVIYRDGVCFGVMNLYPYTPGHFMLIPHKHCDCPSLLDTREWQHIHMLSQKAFDVLYEYGASGINMGMNIKQAGGAGLPEHIHLHFVPRYLGDTNFLTSIADARTYGIDFDSVFLKIKTLCAKHFTRG